MASKAYNLLQEPKRDTGRVGRVDSPALMMAGPILETVR